MSRAGDRGATPWSVLRYDPGQDLETATCCTAWDARRRIWQWHPHRLPNGLACLMKSDVFPSLASSRHAFHSEPMTASLALVADGLAQLSNFALGWTHRVRWTWCNGFLRGESDCLADKGFSLAEITLARGLNVDIYNLHADAGRGAADVRARRANFEQLAAYVQTRSKSHAVIVAGDTNLHLSRTDDAVTFERFLRATGLAAHHRCALISE